MKSFERLKNFNEKKKRIDFVWSNYKNILYQIEEETVEVREAIQTQESEARVRDEVGDLLQAVLSLIEFLGYSETEILEQSLDKLEQRITRVEILMQHDGLKTLKGLSRGEKLAYWMNSK